MTSGEPPLTESLIWGVPAVRGRRIRPTEKTTRVPVTIGSLRVAVAVTDVWPAVHAVWVNVARLVGSDDRGVRTSSVVAPRTKAPSAVAEDASLGSVTEMVVPDGSCLEVVNPTFRSAVPAGETSRATSAPDPDVWTRLGPASGLVSFIATVARSLTPACPVAKLRRGRPIEAETPDGEASGPPRGAGMMTGPMVMVAVSIGRMPAVVGVRVVICHVDCNPTGVLAETVLNAGLVIPVIVIATVVPTVSALLPTKFSSTSGALKYGLTVKSPGATVGVPLIVRVVVSTEMVERP